ncbi:hypothetical protein STEG23_014947 [Scotinomys teguina]
MQTSPEVLHQDLADFRVSHPDLTPLQYVDDILLTAETEQECLQANSKKADLHEYVLSNEKLGGWKVGSMVKSTAALPEDWGSVPSTPNRNPFLLPDFSQPPKSSYAAPYGVMTHSL